MDRSLLVAFACWLPGQGPELDAQRWKRVEPGIELVYPADHGAHLGHAIEWWYLTGQLESEDGRRFGFQFTVFRKGLDARPAEPGSSPLRARQVYAGHLAVTDVAGGRTRFAERLRRGGTALARAAEGELDLVLEDWSLQRSAEDRLEVKAGDPAQGIELALVLRPAKPLVLHGERGYSEKGGDPGNASAYASWTRLETAGRLRLDGSELAVRGSSWFDHEFGSGVLAEGIVGWDWFGLQLDDGRELMLFVLRTRDGGAAPASAATLVERDGTARALRREDFTLTSSATWTSPRTNASYPASWAIAIPGAGLELELLPLVADCELVSSASTGVTYWEGPVEIRGPLTGRGYAELTGYAGSVAGRF